MCFSATASFTAAIILMPIGIYCLNRAINYHKLFWPIALLPLIFGFQQFFEGLVWLGFESDSGATSRYAALIYLFFSHVFWLVWIPFACYVVENNPVKKKLFFILILIGATYGLSLYIPLWGYENWLGIELVNHSIEYKTTLLYDRYISKEIVSLFYTLIILVPLLGASDRYIRTFGIVIVASVIITILFLDYAFISVWCYFSALLSFYILVLIMNKDRKNLID